MLAEITGRIPVIHWGGESYFSDSPARDIFATLFEPVSPTGLADLIGLENASVFPSKWRGRLDHPEALGKWTGPDSRMPGIAFLRRPETIAVFDYYTSIAELAPWIPAGHALSGHSVIELYRSLAAKYLRPRPEIAAEVDRFKARFLPDSYVAVHVRGGDKNREIKNLDAINEKYASVVDQILAPSGKPIFVSTDDRRRLDSLRARYKDRIVATDCARVDSDIGLHLLPGGAKRNLAVEVLVDTYIALAADAFVGNGYSNASAVIATIKLWPPRTCWLIRKNLLLDPILEIHTGRVA